MEADLIFRIITQNNYPFLYRHDRSIYQSHPQIDPLNLAKTTAVAAFAGYWVGKFNKGREGVFVFAFTLPVFVKYLYDEWNLSQSAKKYEEFNIQASLHQQSRKQSISNDPKHLRRHQINNQSRKIVRKMPQLNHKIYNASDFISQLEKDYFK